MRFVLLYAAYVAVTIRHGGAAQQEHELEPLVADPTRHDPPATFTIVGQFVVGLGLIVGRRRACRL